MIGKTWSQFSIGPDLAGTVEFASDTIDVSISSASGVEAV